MDYGDGETKSYTFDEMGNRHTMTDGDTTTYTYDNANRLLTAGGSSYVNDANGNTLTGGGRTNTWDCENRLIQCTKGLNTSTFTYGADGLRRSRTVTNSGTSDTTYYALDGQSVVREMKRNSQNQLVNKATYLTGASGPVYRRDDVTGTYKWYVYDGLGSVVPEIDDSGNPSAPIAFDVYGQRRYGDVGTSPNKFCGSLGHSSDAETDLVYMRARYLDPALGRFVSEDPAANGDNWFVYCDNSPVNGVDESGEEIIWLSKKFWIRWDAEWQGVLKHVHWGRGNVELGCADVSGNIRHPGKFKDWPSNKEMNLLEKNASLAYDTITQAFEQNPLFVIALFLDLAGEFDTADRFYDAAGVQS